MAIQVRRGSYSDFVPSRMLAGEFAVMTADDPNTANGKSVYMAMAPSDVQRLLTENDLGDMSDAAEIATDAAERAEAAIEAIGDISELAVPLMTQDVRGGAKLGAGLQIDANDKLGVKVDGTTITVDSGGTIHGASTYELPTMTANIKGGAKLGDGLRVDDDTLSFGNIVHSGSGAEVVTDGCAIYSVDSEGWVEQQTTTGKNLITFPYYSSAGTSSGVTTFVDSDGKVNISGVTTGAYSFYLTHRISFTLEAGTYTLSVSSSLTNLDMRIGTEAGLLKSITSGSTSFTLTEQTGISIFFVNQNSGQSVSFDGYVQLEAGSTATSYEPYSGGAPSPSPDYPQEIKVARGRNLCQTPTMQANANGGITSETTYRVGSVVTGQTYTISFDCTVASSIAYAGIGFYIDSGTVLQGTNILLSTIGHKAMTFTATASGRLRPYFGNGTYPSNAEFAENIQLELGSTPTPYVPYGYIGLDVYDSQGAHVSTTPIPLPSKGFAASLPDGTADALSVDSAGRWEWANASEIHRITELSNETDLGDGYYRASSNVTPPSITSSVNALCTHLMPQLSWDSKTNHFYMGANAAWVFAQASSTSDLLAKLSDAEILYPLATPTTESGYIGLPALPSGAMVSCPELDEIGVSWFVQGVDELAQHAANWGARALASESRIAALEAAVAELATS